MITKPKYADNQLAIEDGVEALLSEMTIEVMIGSSSGDIRLRGTFSIVAKQTPVQQIFFTEVQSTR